MGATLAHRPRAKQDTRRSGRARRELALMAEETRIERRLDRHIARAVDAHAGRHS